MTASNKIWGARCVDTQDLWNGSIALVAREWGKNLKVLSEEDWAELPEGSRGDRIFVHQITFVLGCMGCSLGTLKEALSDLEKLQKEREYDKAITKGMRGFLAHMSELGYSYVEVGRPDLGICPVYSHR